MKRLIICLVCVVIILPLVVIVLSCVGNNLIERNGKGKQIQEEYERKLKEREKLSVK